MQKAAARGRLTILMLLHPFLVIHGSLLLFEQ
jgi:hypothetical protein